MSAGPWPTWTCKLVSRKLGRHYQAGKNAPRDGSPLSPHQAALLRKKSVVVHLPLSRSQSRSPEACSTHGWPFRLISHPLHPHGPPRAAAAGGWQDRHEGAEESNVHGFLFTQCVKGMPKLSGEELVDWTRSQSFPISPAWIFFFPPKISWKAMGSAWDLTQGLEGTVYSVGEKGNWEKKISGFLPAPCWAQRVPRHPALPPLLLPGPQAPACLGPGPPSSRLQQCIDRRLWFNRT